MLRDYRPGDTEILIALFRDTVRATNLGAYTRDQVLAWAPDEIDLAAWTERQARSRTLIAERDECLLGFAELQDGAHLHMLYVHKDYQGQGIASALLRRVEVIARKHGTQRLTTDASITARAFFECKGFIVAAPQTVTRSGQIFRSFRMEKAI